MSIPIMLEFHFEFSLSRYSCVSTIDCRYTQLSGKWLCVFEIQGAHHHFFILPPLLFKFHLIWSSLWGTCSSNFCSISYFFPFLTGFSYFLMTLFVDSTSLSPVYYVYLCILQLVLCDPSASPKKKVDCSISLW